MYGGAGGAPFVAVLWPALRDVRRVCCERVKASTTAQVGGSEQTGRILPVLK